MFVFDFFVIRVSVRPVCPVCVPCVPSVSRLCPRVRFGEVRG